MRILCSVLVVISLGFFANSALMADRAPDKDPGTKEEPKKEEPKKEEPKDEKLDLPWTADELKKSVKAGSTMLFKIEQTIGEKTTTSYQKMEITTVTDEGYTMKTTQLTAEKKERGKPSERTQKWSEYMSNMKFTKANTTVSEEKIKVTAGEYDCKVYKKVDKSDAGESTTTYYFPKDKVGMLVKVTIDSKVVKMTMALEELTEGK